MYIMVDIEADGPIPGDYSMTEIGAVFCRDLEQTYYGQLRPISEKWVPSALGVTGRSREETLSFPGPQLAMIDFASWVNDKKAQLEEDDRLTFISDNNGFDFMFVCWYFWHFNGENPFGPNSDNLRNLFGGLRKNAYANFKRLRKTKHTHNPVDDALGNVEALITMRDEFGLRINL